MELAYIFLTAFVVGLSGAMMPGPLLTVTVTESARRGFVAGPLLMLGHALLEGVLVIAVFLGLGTLLAGPQVSSVIAVIGGAFLLWLGWDMSHAAYKGRVALEYDTENANADRVPARKTLHPVAAGVLVSLSNPYWVIWWATIGMGYITMSLKHGTLGILSFFSGHILADLAWYSLVAAAVAGSRRFLSPRVYRVVIITCGIFLVVLGASFIYYGFSV